MMLTKKSLLLVLVVFSVCHACAAQAQQTGSKASLLISYMEGDDGDVQHVERLDFKDGALVSRKRVVTLNHDADGYANSVVGNRYLLTVYRNKIFDLQEGRFTDRLPASLEVSAKAELSGVVSPDGTKRVNAGVPFSESTDTLEIHFTGKPTVVVRESFRVTRNKNSSSMPWLPLLWVDDERILTQRSNGNLVIVSTGGTVTPLLQIPCASESGPGLERNRSGKIVYRCGGNLFSVDVKNGNYEKIRHDLGNNFEVDHVGGDSVYYFKGEEVGRGGLNAVSTKSNLAMLYGEVKDGVIDSAEIKTVEVWNETKRGWTKLTVDGWGAQIVGWVEE